MECIGLFPSESASKTAVRYVDHPIPMPRSFISLAIADGYLEEIGVVPLTLVGEASAYTTRHTKRLDLLSRSTAYC
jgi:hypothetical protein